MLQAACRPRLISTAFQNSPLYLSPNPARRWVDRPIHPISLRQLFFFGRVLTENRLLSSANYVRTELPTRLAHRLRDMQRLPYVVVTNPHLSTVYELYYKSFETFRRVPVIRTLEENNRYCKMISDSLKDHLPVIPNLVIGVLQCQAFMEPDVMDQFAQAMLRARISRRVIAEQHLALTETFNSPSHVPQQSSENDFVGEVLLRCNAKEVIERCGKVAQDLCRAPDGTGPVVPEIKVQGHTNATFPYVLNHLEYIIGELLRNSIQAVMEKHRHTSKPPPIEVLICEAPQQVIIRFSDQGGGIPRDIRPFLWSFNKGPRTLARLESLGQVPELAATMQEVQHPMTEKGNGGDSSLSTLASRPPSLRLGMGLPMSKVYAEYWAGGLELHSLEGYGVDAFLQISKLGNQNEQLSSRASIDAFSGRRFGDSYNKSSPFSALSPPASKSSNANASSAFGLGSGAFASFGATKTPKTPGSGAGFDFSTKEKKEKDAEGGTGADKTEATALSDSSSARPDSASGQHELRYSWNLYYRPPANKFSDYEKSIAKVAGISTVETFWAVYTHLKRPSALPTVSDYHIFKDGIRPVWEDEANKKGGKWIVRLKKGVADRYWEDLLMAIIGDQFLEAADEVCGAVLSVRSGEDVLSVWTKIDGGRNIKIRETIKRILAFPPDTNIVWKSHDDSIAQRSALDEARHQKTSAGPGQPGIEKRRSTLQDEGEHEEPEQASDIPAEESTVKKKDGPEPVLVPDPLEEDMQQRRRSYMPLHPMNTLNDSPASAYPARSFNRRARSRQVGLHPVPGDVRDSNGSAPNKKQRTGPSPKDVIQETATNGSLETDQHTRRNTIYHGPQSSKLHVKLSKSHGEFSNDFVIELESHKRVWELLSIITSISPTVRCVPWEDAKLDLVFERKVDDLKQVGPMHNLRRKHSPSENQVQPAKLASTKRNQLFQENPTDSCDESELKVKDSLSGTPSTRSTQSVTRLEMDNIGAPSPGVPFSERIGLGPQWTSPLVYPKESKKREIVEYCDLLRLDEDQFLNDSLISFFIRYLQYQLELSDLDLLKKMHFFNTYFFDTLTKNSKGRKDVNHAGVSRWTKNIDIFSRDFVIVPVNDNLHWYLAIICNLSAFTKARRQNGQHEQDYSADGAGTCIEITEDHQLQEVSQDGIPGQLEHQTRQIFQELSLQDTQNGRATTSPETKDRSQMRARNSPSRPKGVRGKRYKPSKSLPKYDPETPIIITLDSLGQARGSAVSALKQYVVLEAKDKKDLDIDREDLKGMTAKGIPSQSNYSDCGLYMCMYLEQFVADPYAFVKKILQREDADLRWPDKIQSDELRSRLRQLILDLHRQQEGHELEREIPPLGSIMVELRNQSSDVIASTAPVPSAELAAISLERMSGGPREDVNPSRHAEHADAKLSTDQPQLDEQGDMTTKIETRPTSPSSQKRAMDEVDEARRLSREAA
ncbi:hypothetical protein DV735_g1800, partial [Chaetothyriales sp. CBS 134920]